MAITVKTCPDPNGQKHTIALTFDQVMMMESTERGIIEEIIRVVASRYVEENYPQLVALLDQQAIANLAIAEAGQRIAKVIHERPIVMKSDGPKTVINKRSIF